MCNQITVIESKTISGKSIDVDSCIAGLVDYLNKGGYRTVASCCGHGKGIGIISLADGRELIITKDYETARLVEKLYFNHVSDKEYSYLNA